MEMDKSYTGIGDNTITRIKITQWVNRSDVQDLIEKFVAGRR